MGATGLGILGHIGLRLAILADVLSLQDVLLLWWVYVVILIVGLLIRREDSTFLRLGIIDHGELILLLLLWMSRLLVLLVYKVLLICGGSRCLVKALTCLKCVCISLRCLRNLHSTCVLWINLQLRGSTSRLHVIFKLSYSKLHSEQR